MVFALKERKKKTRIVCTIGPASEDEKMLRKLILAGMNVMRLNFSHGDFEEHGGRIKTARKLGKELSKNIPILLDTKGPEIRTGNFVGGQTEFKKGQVSVITTEGIEGTSDRFTITYKELRELSYMGASVLHENSVFPVRKEGIPIHIKNTNRPQDPGTLIVESTCHKPAHVITGIAGKQGFATVMIEKDMMNSEIGFGRKVLQVFEDYHISFEHMPSGIDTMTVIVNTEEFIDKEQDILAGLHRSVHPDSIILESDLSLIAVVGRGMKASRGTAARVFKALAKENINIKMIDQGSSELNIIIGVRNCYFKPAIKAIYKEFIDNERDGL